MRSMVIGALAASLALAGAASGQVKTEEVTYAQGATTLQGFLAFDQAAKGKRPGVLVIHEWWGHNQHARNQALRLARAGFVAFALDMYGKGKATSHPKEAQAYMQQVTGDLPVLTARFDAALDLLKKRPEVDPGKIAAVGYCFGGTVALTMARAGADLQAVVALHAGLKPVGPPALPGKVKPQILVLVGAADPFVPREQIDAFRKEMQDAGARFEVVAFPGAKHSFTNPDASRAGMSAAAYDATADRKSYEAMVKFLRKVLG